MVNQETSESLLDKLILQIFEEQEDAFSFPLTTMKETRDFVRLLNRQGFTYEMICEEIDEKFDSFRNWRLGGGPDSIGRRTMVRLNKPLQEAMLSDGEDEEEMGTNGTTGEKASGGAKRKKSVDVAGMLRRRSRVDSVDGEKVAKSKEEGGTKKEEPEKKEEGKGKSLEMGKTDTKDGKNDNHPQPLSPKHNAKTETVAKDATLSNTKTNDQISSKTGSETPKENSKTATKHDVKKDASKELEASTELRKKEHEVETGKKELALRVETSRKEREVREVADQKEVDRNSEAKPKTPTQKDPKSPDSPKHETKEKPEELKMKDTKEEKKEPKPKTENRTKADEIIEKTSVKTPPVTKTPPKPLDAGPEKSPRSTEPQATIGSTPFPKQEPSSPSSPTSPSFKPGSKQTPDVQPPSQKDKSTTDLSPKTNTDTHGPHKISEALSSPTTKSPTSKIEEPSKDNQKPDPAKPDRIVAAQNNLNANKLETKILTDESKTTSTGKVEKSVDKTPAIESATPSTLKAGNVVRSKSETVDSKTDETPQAPSVARTSSYNSELIHPTTSPKTDSKLPSSEPTQTTVDENYDSDLDPETADHSTEDSALIARLHSLKRNPTKDGPGHLFVFSDTPAATGTGKHRVRVGKSRFPEKRLAQAQIFNPDIRMVTSVAVEMRKDALCQVQEQLKAMSLRGKSGWYWGSLEVILKAVTDLGVEKEATIE